MSISHTTIHEMIIDFYTIQGIFRGIYNPGFSVEVSKTLEIVHGLNTTFDLLVVHGRCIFSKTNLSHSKIMKF